MDRATLRILQLVLALPCLLGRGAAAQEWAHEYGAGAARAVAATPDGGFIVGGTTLSPDSPGGGDIDQDAGDALLMKLAASGTVEWAVALGSARSESEEFAGVAVLADGYLAAGAFADEGMLVVARFDLSGNLVWQRGLGVDVLAYLSRVLVPSTDGQFFVAFNMNDPAGSFDSIVKFSADGAVMWHRGVDRGTPGGGLRYSAPLPIVGVDGGGVVLLQPHATGDGWLPRLVAFDAAGTLLWAREFGSEPDFYLPLDLARLPDGSLALAGAVSADGSPDHWLARTDASGSPTWQARFGIAFESDSALRVAPTADGGVLVVGTFGAVRNSASISRVDAAGFLVSTHEIAAQSGDVVATPGGPIVVGPVGLERTITVARLDTDGHATTSCLAEVGATMEQSAPPAVSAPVVPIEHAFTTIPVDTAFTLARLAVIPECVAGCAALDCYDISVTPWQPCPGDPVSLSLDMRGGDGAVTVAWDLDSDGTTDVSGNPVVVTAPSGPWRIMATATDNCAAGPQSCAEVLRLTVSAPLGEVSDVFAGAPPLRVRGTGIVSVERLPGATAYNLYIGRIGTWYDADAASGLACAVGPWSNNGDGTITLPGSMPPGSWILVTASNRCFEGGAGTDSFGVERATDASWAGCGPAP